MFDKKGKTIVFISVIAILAFWMVCIFICAQRGTLPRFDAEGKLINKEQSVPSKLAPPDRISQGLPTSGSNETTE